MSAKENTKGCVTIIFFFTTMGFILILFQSITGLLFEGDSFVSNFTDSKSDTTNIRLLRFSFWAFIVMAILFFALGGKIKDYFK